MKHRTALAGLALLGSISGCGDYATRGDLERLEARYVATHDTMVALWEFTDSVAQIIRDTVPRPPCGPRCVLEMPPAPPRIGEGVTPGP